MSGVTNIKITADTGITDIEFVGGGIVKITQRKTAKSKPILTADFTPTAESIKGKGSLVGAIVTAIGTGKTLDSLGTVVFY